MSQASQHLRALIDKVILTPNETGEELTVDLIGDLTGILSVVTTSESIRIAAELSKLQQVHQELSGRTRKATPKGLWCRVLLYKYIGCGSPQPALQNSPKVSCLNHLRNEMQACIASKNIGCSPNWPPTRLGDTVRPLSLSKSVSEALLADLRLNSELVLVPQGQNKLALRAFT